LKPARVPKVGVKDVRAGVAETAIVIVVVVVDVAVPVAAQAAVREVTVVAIRAAVVVDEEEGKYF
jgi:hypothetical protein